MRLTSVLCLCLLLSLCSWQVVAQVYGSWTLVAGASDGFADANWQCASGNGLSCSTYKNPNNAQNIPSIALSSTYVKFPACAPNQVLPYNTGGSPILWPSINYQTVTPDCYTVYITGTMPTFSIYKSVNPMPSLKFVPSSADVMVEQISGSMVMPYLYVNTNDGRKVTVAGSDTITIQSLYFTRPSLFTFQKSRSSTTGVVSVAISNVTIEYSNNPSTNGAWNVNSVGGLALSGYFNLTATLTSTYQLSISNQTNVGTVIGVNFADLIVNNAALILNSVTSGANSRMNNTAVALNDQVATLKLTGLWTITSSTSFTGVGVLDLTTALPTNGFALPSTHTSNTINVAAGATLLATGSFSQVTLSSAGSFVVDRQNAEGIMDISALNGDTVTLKNGKFHLSKGRATILLVSAELTIVGDYGGSISGDADSTVIIDSTTIVKPPSIETDGDVRFWNYPYTLLGGPNSGKGVFFEKKSQITLYRTDSLNSATTVDDATLNIDSTFVFGAPITIQNNGIVYFNQGAELDVTFANVSFSNGGQIINSVPIAINSSCIFGTKGAKSGQFLSYSAIVVSNNITFTTDQLVLKENASLTVEASSFVSASSLYLAPWTWLDFAGTIELATDFINDGQVYWGGKDTVGNSVLTGTYAQNANGTTFLTVNYLNGTHAEGEFDTLTVTGDVYLFGTLQIDFANPTEALALPDKAWYPIMSVSGISGGVFDKVEHNLGADVTLSLCFTASQGILVFNHNSTTSTVAFEDLPDSCDFVNPVPVAAPVDFGESPTGSEPDSSRISSAVSFVASYIVLLFSVVVLTVC